MTDSRFHHVPATGPDRWKPEGDDLAFDELEAERKDFLRQFKAFLTSYYGKRCKKRVPGCPTCYMWAMYDLIETLIV